MFTFFLLGGSAPAATILRSTFVAELSVKTPPPCCSTWKTGAKAPFWIRKVCCTRRPRAFFIFRKLWKPGGKIKRSSW